jgi:hypothetical protein
MQRKRPPRPNTANKSLWRVLHGSTTTPAERRAAYDTLRAAGLEV